jgi:GNAT superfamily N-acetyltransferase
VTVTAADTVPAEAIFAALEATWPPRAWHAAPGWRVGEGAGGGRRVSCGVASAPDAAPEALAEAQRALGQPALALIRGADAALDARLADAGWRTLAPTLAVAAPVPRLAVAPPRVTAFEVEWPPLQVQVELWARGGVGPARRAVMARAAGPRVALLGRADDSPVATAFAACHGTLAMVHALEVAPDRRRRGLARHLIGAAALWAARQGAASLAMLVMRDNAPACALARALGMDTVAQYHYRLREESP